MGNLDGKGFSDLEKYAIALEKQLGWNARNASQPFDGITANIRADYEEFKPETFKGFTVDFSDETMTHGPFASEEEAEEFALSRAQKVYTMSSVDNYKADLRAAGKSA